MKLDFRRDACGNDPTPLTLKLRRSNGVTKLCNTKLCSCPATWIEMEPHGRRHQQDSKAIADGGKSSSRQQSTYPLKKLFAGRSSADRRASVSLVTANVLTATATSIKMKHHQYTSPREVR